MKEKLLTINLLPAVFLLVSCDNELAAVKITDNTVITVNIKGNSVSFINIETGEIVREWSFTTDYSGGLLLEDKDSLLLYGKYVDSIDIFSISTGKKIDSWNTGKGITNGQLLYDGRIAFADQHLNKVRVFNINGSELGNVITGKNPLTILQSEIEENLLYVISFDHKIMSIIDLDDFRTVRTIHIHANAAGAIINEARNEIWIGGHGEHDKIEQNIHVYNLETGKLSKEISAAFMPINFIQCYNYIYALSHGTSTVYKFSEDGQLVDKLKVAANPFDMKIKDDKLFVAGYDNDEINIINLQSFTIEKTIKVGKGPFQIILRGNSDE